VRSKKYAGLAALAAAAVALGACSSSKSSTATNQSVTTTTLDASTLPTLPADPTLSGTLSGPGVTSSTITIGQITTISGPVPGLFQGANWGLDGWAAWVNANGGIAGRQVKIVHVDDAFSCTTYKNAMQQFSTSAFAVVGNLTLEDTCGKAALQADPNLLDIQALTLDPTLYSVPNVYTANPDPPGGITTGLDYMKAHYPNAVTKAALLAGQAAAANGREEQLTAESEGYHYLYTEDVPDLTTNFTSYILRMKNEGVQFVDMTALAVTSAANFLQQAAQQNFHPQVLYSASAYDAQFFKLLGKANANSTSDLFAVEAWSAAQLLATAMHNAGSSITQSSVSAALNNIHSFNANGLTGTTDPGAKMGTHCVVMAHVENGQWVRADPTTPGQFDCSGTYHSLTLAQIEH
jgi:ABC-type branched-subunit amino acid transport system substrate-binding protein